MDVKFWILLFGLLPFVRSQNISDVKALRTYLFTTNDYDKTIRPIENQSYPMDVTVQFVLNNVNVLDELEETMTTTGYLIVTWTDDQLTWNPNKYGNILTLFWPQSQVWTPEIALKNSFGNFENLGYDSLNLKIYFLGLVAWYPHQVFVTTCTINVKYFPFDRQVCQIKLTSWNYGTSQMTFNNESSIDISRYQESPSWTLESTSFNFITDGYEPQINFILTLKRRASYTIVSVVLPICLLAILNLLVFSLPGSSGEKVGYAVTVFLSLAVFLTIIDSSLPKNSQTVPVFSLYMMLLVVQSTVITILAIILVKMLTNDELGKPVPWLMVKFTQMMEFKCCKPVKQNNKVMDVSKGNDGNIKAMDNILEDDTEDTDHDVTWARLVRMLDRFLLWFFTLTFVVFTVVFGAIVAS